MSALSRTAKRDILAATPLFSSVSRADLNTLADLATERHVVKDEQVMRRGDTDSSLLVLVHGSLRAGTTSPEGRELTLNRIEAGSVLGEIALLDGRPRSLDVTATSEGLLLTLQRRDVLPFIMARPQLMLQIMMLLCERLRANSTTIESLALAPLATRLARLLLALAESHGVKTPEGVLLRIRMSQKEMSTQVAATRERVNKQLRQWHEAGVLGEAADRHLLLRQPRRLRALVEGECYH